jgi:hypothetical protein
VLLPVFRFALPEINSQNIIWIVMICSSGRDKCFGVNYRVPFQDWKVCKFRNQNNLQEYYSTLKIEAKYLTETSFSEKKQKKKKKNKKTAFRMATALRTLISTAITSM